MAAMVDERGAQAQLHGAGMTGRVECRYYGRDFTAGEMALLRALIAAYQSASKIDPLSACNIDPLSGTAEVVPVVNRGDPSGFV